MSIVECIKQRQPAHPAASSHHLPLASCTCRLLLGMCLNTMVYGRMLKTMGGFWTATHAATTRPKPSSTPASTQTSSSSLRYAVITAQPQQTTGTVRVLIIHVCSLHLSSLSVTDLLSSMAAKLAVISLAHLCSFGHIRQLQTWALNPTLCCQPLLHDLCSPSQIPNPGPGQELGPVSA